MRFRNFGTTLGLLLAMALAVSPAWGADRNGQPARPGTVNYVEGQVSIHGVKVDQKSVGSVAIEQNQEIMTNRGRAEVLLTPGIFLRLDDNSAVQMISPNLTDMEVGLERGRATIEVAYIRPENNLQVHENGANARLEKRGFYEFDANRNDVKVFNGEALVREGDKNIKVKGDHELVLTGEEKARKFSQAAARDDFYNWNSLRSSYIAEANTNIARRYVVDGGWYGPGWWGPGWIGTGWYWNPWFDCYTWLPADRIFYSPFGFGFYAPIYAYRAPVVIGHLHHEFGTGYRPAIVGRGHVWHGGSVWHGREGWRGEHPGVAPRAIGPEHFGGLSAGGGFRGGFHGGGFHGAGGFHGRSGR